MPEENARLSNLEKASKNENTHPLGQPQVCPFHQGYQYGGFLDLKGANVSKDGKTARWTDSLTVDALASAEYDGDRNELGRNGHDTTMLAIFITELKLSRRILRNVSESVHDPCMGARELTSAASKNALASHLYSATICSFSPSSSSLSRNHTRPKSSSLMNPSPTASHLASVLCALGVPNTGQYPSSIRISRRAFFASRPETMLNTMIPDAIQTGQSCERASKQSGPRPRVHTALEQLLLRDLHPVVLLRLRVCRRPGTWALVRRDSSSSRCLRSSRRSAAGTVPTVLPLMRRELDGDALLVPIL